MKENKKNKGKRGLALLISAVALFIFAGSLLAYFSDQVNDTAQITAGTLDISGEYKIYVNGSTTPLQSNTLSNFNPGDHVLIKAEIQNNGSKSAWIRDSVTIDGELKDIKYGPNSTPVVQVYKGNITDFTQPGVTPLDLETSKTFTSSIQVMNGSVEKDGSLEEYVVEYTIRFAPEAKNDAQNKSIDFKFVTEALQYRNNANGSDATDSGWQNIETTTIATP